MVSSQHSFYLLSEIFISLIGAILLLAIWSVIQKKFKHKLIHEIAVKRVDKGLLYLSLSVFVWSISGMITLIGSSVNEWAWPLLISQNIFSILNSLFLILSLYYFDHAPTYLYNNIANTRRVIWVFVGVSIFSFLLAWQFGDTVNTYGLRLSAIPDLILSGILSWLLVISLYRTFMDRKMAIVAIISVVAISLLFLSQGPQVFYVKSFNFLSDLLKIVAKTGLISIFLVLGTSWVIELSQTPTIPDMKIHFTDWNQVVLSVPSKGIVHQKIEFGKKTTQFNNLFKFAIRRKFGHEQDMCIEVHAGGEILSQTYLSRIIENINEILGLKDDHRLQRNDLFTFIGQGKYRLRFLPETISIDSALLTEFVYNTDNQRYKSFLSE